MILYRMPGHLIRRLHQKSVHTFQRTAREAGFDLMSVQYAAMDAIRANPGVGQATIASIIAYDRATIGGVIDRLVAKGLVTRRPSASDRRANEVHLTDDGERIYLAFQPVVIGLQDEILGDLEPEERDQFLRLIARATGVDRLIAETEARDETTGGSDEDGR